MSDLFDLSGKTALVTGANTGLGQAIAVGLAQAGADIVAVGRSAPNETRSLVADAGRKLTAIAADLSSTEPIARVMADAGPIDILVNNAGVIRRADSVDFTEADWDAVMDTNLKVAFFLSQAAAKGWIAEGRGGKIIPVASMLSFQGGVRVPSYTASKSGLAGLTRALANEWAARGINVNAITPGATLSETQVASSSGNYLATRVSGRALQRAQTPDDLVGAVMFLSTAASDFITGQTLNVDGGKAMH